MQTVPMHTFECQMYVPAHGRMNLCVPSEPGPVKVARFRPMDYEELADPGFRKLLAAFESIPKPLILNVC